MNLAVKYPNDEAVYSSQTILQRIAGADKSAVGECLNAYGGFIWNSVKNASISNGQAEIIVQEVFNDIWKFARRFDAAQISETDFIFLLIRQRLRVNGIH